MQVLPLLDVLVVAALASVALVTVLTVRHMLSPGSGDLERCREELRRYTEEASARERALREHYEQLLKDSAIRNAMMVGLWGAYRSGELTRCYQKGGKVRVLADGTVVCEKGEESYAVRTGEPADK